MKQASPRAELALPAAMSPRRYIEKVRLATGELVDEEIHPEELLVHHYRDYHVVEVQARRIMSQVVKETGDEELARRRLRQARDFGKKTAGMVARAFGGSGDPARLSRALFGIEERECFYRYRRHPWSSEEISHRLERVRRRAQEQLAAISQGGRPAIHMLLTGASGFVGKEVLWQAAHDRDVREVVAVIRPKGSRSAEARGQRLLDLLWIDDPAVRAKFRFVEGDVEQPRLGLAAEVVDELATRLTHLVHAAASVAFDGEYEESFRANVEGTAHALALSLELQAAPQSPFVAHLAIETSYIHGRQVRRRAREDQIVFPRNFYNNYYELTKAMASLEAERFMLGEGLRVIQLCPAIVIGEARTGNNRGDTKVVNAPVNLFGRAQQALAERPRGKWMERSTAALLARMACIFPGDPSAQINMIPVDRVVAGILAALKRPEAVGRRIHLATDKRLTSEEMRAIVAEELGVEVKLAEPTFHRNVTLPVLSKVLTRMGHQRLAQVLQKLGTIFGGYSEWGQPIHEVGNDVRLLGLPAERPDTHLAFRMLCRHNRWVQEFGKVRDDRELSRRERIWTELLAELEEDAGRPAGEVPAADFREWLEGRLDLERFEVL